MKNGLWLVCFWMISITAFGQVINNERLGSRIYLDSKEIHQGDFHWVMKKTTDITQPTEAISKPDFLPQGW